MRQSRLFGKTQKFAPKDETNLSAQFLIRAGFINKEMTGVYSFLPLGLRVLRKIENIIRNEMDNIGGQELQLTVLQRKEIWEKTGRWNDEVINNWFKTKLKNETELGLAFTHEEPVTNLVNQYVNSYKDLPLYPYEIGIVFRNELRAKSGIMRGREFNWKALYSFSISEEEHNKFYEKCSDAYLNIFNKVGLGEITYKTFASGGTFSEYSHEFQTLSETGEDIIYLDKKKKIAINKEIYDDKIIKKLGLKKEDLVTKKAIEVGNIFSLGYKFSEPLGAKFKNEKEEINISFMGCYGIGISRLMGTIAEIYNDEKGLTWPKGVAPFDLHLILIGNEIEERKLANKIYSELKDNKIDLLFDDREVSPGNKFKDSDLIGIPQKLIISRKGVENKIIEIEDRVTGSKKEVKINNYIKTILDEAKK